MLPPTSAMNDVARVDIACVEVAGRGEADALRPADVADVERGRRRHGDREAVLVHPTGTDVADGDRALGLAVHEVRDDDIAAVDVAVGVPFEAADIEVAKGDVERRDEVKQPADRDVGAERGHDEIVAGFERQVAEAHRAAIGDEANRPGADIADRTLVKRAGGEIAAVEAGDADRAAGRRPGGAGTGGPSERASENVRFAGDRRAAAVDVEAR